MTIAQPAVPPAFPPAFPPVPDRLRTPEEQAADWTDSAAAARILAGIAADPPPRVRRTRLYALTREDWHEYEGADVDRLAALRDAAGQRALAHGHATGDYRPLSVWAALGTVHELIDATLDGVAAARAIARAAA